ncbi:MAG: hypothetical protein M1830_007295 [Pleopsidium flavum]|nr:MAG: hypothetical protein M1830_007295 [Pleopsidium flavum]
MQPLANLNGAHLQKGLLMHTESQRICSRTHAEGTLLSKRRLTSPVDLDCVPLISGRASILVLDALEEQAPDPKPPLKWMLVHCCVRKVDILQSQATTYDLNLFIVRSHPLKAPTRPLFFRVPYSVPGSDAELIEGQQNYRELSKNGTCWPESFQLSHVADYFRSERSWRFEMERNRRRYDGPG